MKLNFLSKTTLILILLSFAACGGQQDSAPSPAATAAATEDVSSEVPATVTAIPTIAQEQATAASSATPAAAQTQEPDPAQTEEPVSILSDEYAISISNIVEEGSFPQGTPPAPQGQRWVIVLVALSNQTSAGVLVTPGSLFLIAEDGARYPAEAPDAATMPPAVGENVGADSSVYGLARFAVPQNLELLALEWCPGEDCDNPVRTPFS